MLNETRQYYTLYNSLEDQREYMEKEVLDYTCNCAGTHMQALLFRKYIVVIPQVNIAIKI